MKYEVWMVERLKSVSGKNKNKKSAFLRVTSWNHKSFENDMLEGATSTFCGNIDRPAHMNVPDDFVANKIFNRAVYATHPSVNYRKGQ